MWSSVCFRRNFKVLRICASTIWWVYYKFLNFKCDENRVLSMLSFRLQGVFWIFIMRYLFIEVESCLEENFGMLMVFSRTGLVYKTSNCLLSLLGLSIFESFRLCISENLFPSLNHSLVQWDLLLVEKHSFCGEGAWW